MIITQVQRERADEIKESGNVEQKVKDTLRVIACLIPDKEQDIANIYNSLYGA